MIFGNKGKFAIELIPRFCEAGRLFGSVVVFADSEEIGDRDVVDLLSTPVHYFERSLRYCGHRGIPIDTYNREELWNVLNMEAFGGAGDDEDFVSRVPAAHRFVVLTNFAPSFDAFICFLVEYDDFELLLWKRWLDPELKHVVLEPGYYREIVEETVRSSWREWENDGA